MSRTNCHICNEPLNEDQIRWAFDDPLCESCFSEGYTYCSQCDTLISRSETQYDNDSEPFCSDCWQEHNDDDSPNNPKVYDADRSLIIELSRCWLLGKKPKKSIITVNPNDHLLLRIRDRIGLVDNPIYLFGLQDREEYQLSVTKNLMEDVREFILLNGLDWKIIEGMGCNRLGIAYSLRSQYTNTIIDLIKELTQVREKVLV
jgi:hypothetical protein